MAVSLWFCRINTRTHISLSVVRLCTYRRPSSLHCSAFGEASASSVSEFNPKVSHHNLRRSKNYNRKGFGYKEETLERMSQKYMSCITFWRPSITFGQICEIVNKGSN